MTPRPPQPPDARQREGLLIGRLLATLTSVSLGGLALWFLHLGVYVGHGKSGHETVLTGPSATAMTTSLLALAGLPLALWARSGRQAGWWATGCAVVAAVAFLVILRVA